MTALVRPTEVEHLGGRVLKVTFDDGLVRELDFAETLTGILATIDSDSIFPLAAIDPAARTVTWPNGIDLDPDVLHGDNTPASAPAPTLIRQYQLANT